MFFKWYHMQHILIALVLVALAGSSAQAQTPLVVNGSFEQDATGWTITGNAGTVTGATVDGAKLLVYNAGDTSPNGIATQAIPTVVGRAYMLTASVGAIGNAAVSQSIRISALAGTTVLSSVTVAATPSVPNATWSVKTLAFTATSVATALSFQDVSSGSVSTDLFLDKISVVDTTVQPPGPDPCVLGVQPVIVQGASPKVVWQQPKTRPASTTDPTVITEVTDWFTFTFDGSAPITATGVQPVTTCPNGLWGYVWPVPSSVVLMPGQRTLTMSAGNTAKGEGAQTTVPFVVAEQPPPTTVIMPPTAPLSVRIVP